MDKALIIRTALGKKPATWSIIESEKWEDGEVKRAISADRWEYIEQLLSGFGLHCITSTRITDNTFVQPKDGRHLWVGLGDIFLAQSLEVAKELSEAHRRNDVRRLGELFGFPQTAIDAFMTKDLVPTSEWPESTDDVSRDDMQFLNHMISKQHWRDEIAYLPELASDTKRISPKIYRDCIQRKSSKKRAV